MSDKNNNIPLECPSKSNTAIADPIKNVVENAITPPIPEEADRIISKAQPE